MTDVLSVLSRKALLGAALASLLVARSAYAQPSQTAMVPMHDGVKLATDIYFPARKGPYPVVLIRTPYDKLGKANQAFAKSLKLYGIATVIQDLRGRFHSEGRDCVFRCDATDGVDTLAWIDKQTWSNHKVVSWGGSALGIVQYMVAPAHPSNLEAMWAAIATPAVFDHAFSWGGVFRQALGEGWLKSQGSAFFLADIAAHPLDDGFWDSIQTQDRFDKVDVPAVHYGGWYDIFAQGTLDAFMGYQHHGGVHARGKQKLIMGPWTHVGLLQRKQGELTYPKNAKNIPSGQLKTLISWIRTYLGLTQGTAEVDAIPTVQYYVMGDVTDAKAPGNVWRSAKDWPIPAAPIRFYLQPGGKLAETCPSTARAATTYVYDPANPSPTQGGANLKIAAGPHDQTSIEARADVVAFETTPLTAPMEITGRIRAHLWVDTDVKDTDIIVRLTDVYPDGRSMLVLDGAQGLSFLRGKKKRQLVPPGTVVEAVVDLWSTSIILNTGHKLRISVTSANAPRFWPNPNDGSTYPDRAHPASATVHLHHEVGHASYVELPNPQRKASEVVVCAGGGPDAGLRDATAGSDRAMSRVDAAGPGGDAPGGIPDASGDGKAPVGPSSGCSCQTAGGGLADGAPLLFTTLGLVGLVVVRRRRHRGVLGGREV